MSEKNTDLLEKVFDRYVGQVYPSKAKVFQMMADQKLTFYFGIDPTGPHIHLGHAVGLIVLKKIIQLGHRGVVLIGDFTAQIGDPTGKDNTRKMLSEFEVRENAKSYISDIERIIPKNSFEIAYNGDWNKKLTLTEVKNLMSHFTVQQMIVRDMFQARLTAQQPIYLHEFLYPLIQGYDSVALNTDGEIGGSDQTFNMMIGRDLVDKLLGKEKIVLATHLLEDPTTGKKLMSKSEGGYIALGSDPTDMFGKVMALPDSAILPIARLATEIPDQVIDHMKERIDRGENPKDVKMELARSIVEMCHGSQAGKEAQKQFESVFSKKETPLEMKEYQVAGQTVIEGMVVVQAASSKSEAKRLIDQGAVKIDGEVVESWDRELKEGEVVQVGPRVFFKVST